MTCFTLAFAFEISCLPPPARVALQAACPVPSKAASSYRAGPRRRGGKGEGEVGRYGGGMCVGGKHPLRPAKLTRYPRRHPRRPPIPGARQAGPGRDAVKLHA